MTLLQWYNLLEYCVYGAIALLILVAIWYCIEVFRIGHPNKSGLAFACVAGMILALMIPQMIIENNLYPPGHCPTCDKTITAKYCEDCGWENDSYFEITDRH